MSYTKPQRIIDKSFDVFIKGSKDISSNLARTAKTIADNNARSKKEQAALQEKRDNEEQEMYDKANTFGSTGDAKLDENVVGFWNDKVDEYFQIKNAMQNGSISRREGNLALTRIEGLSKQFKNQAAYLAGQVSSYRDDSKIKTGAPGSISSVSSQESQQVLNTMMEGGNVQIVERGGVLYYYTPDIVDEDGNVTKKGAMLNGSELMANASTDKDLYNKVQDISKLEQNLFNKALNVDDIVDETYIKTISETKDGKIYKTRQITDPDLAMETILESPGLDTIVGDNEIMTSYFQDVIPDEGEDGYSLTEYYNSDAGKAMRDAGVTVDEFVNSSWGEQVGEPEDPKNIAMAAAQEDAAKRWIANDTLNKNTPGLNSIKGNYFSIENEPKPEKTDNSSSEKEVVVNFVNSTGTKYTSKQQEDFFDQYEREKDIIEATKGIGTGQINDNFLLNLAQKSFPKLLNKNGDGIDPSYGAITSKEDLHNALKEAYELDGGYFRMKKDYNDYQSKSSTGTGGKYNAKK